MDRDTLRTKAAAAPDGTAICTVCGWESGTPVRLDAHCGNLLALQSLDLTLQAVVPALQAAILTVHALVARQIVTQSPDLPVLLLDDNVPRVLLGWGLLQDGAYAA